MEGSLARAESGRPGLERHTVAVNHQPTGSTRTPGRCRFTQLAFLCVVALAVPACARPEIGAAEDIFADIGLPDDAVVIEQIDDRHGAGFWLGVVEPFEVEGPKVPKGFDASPDDRDLLRTGRECPFRGGDEIPEPSEDCTTTETATFSGTHEGRYCFFAMGQETETIRHVGTEYLLAYVGITCWMGG